VLPWPISITNDGRRSQVQTVMDTSAALDPFRAEVRLLDRTVALVIDLRRIPLASSTLAPIWRHKLVGHNLSFDIKMLLANGIDVCRDNLIDTILMSGLVLRGCADKRREGSRRCSLAVAVREALDIELPKASQLSPWWRDRLSDEQIAYAALDAVMSLRLAGALQPRIDKLPSGAQALSRLCNAVAPVARMELAGITLDREGLAQQVQAWEDELSTLKIEIAAIGIGNPGSAPQVGAWLRLELQRLDGTTGSSWLATWPRTETGALSTTAKHLRRLLGHVPSADLLVR
jgi:DNA polymerase-1